MVARDTCWWLTERRPSTLGVALALRERVEAEHGRLPFVLLLNKNDLQDQWGIDNTELHNLQESRSLCPTPPW